MAGRTVHRFSNASTRPEVPGCKAAEALGSGETGAGGGAVRKVYIPKGKTRVWGVPAELPSDLDPDGTGGGGRGGPRPGSGGRALAFLSGTFSPESVTSSIVGFLLGRAMLLGTASPFGLAYLAHVAATRDDALVLTAMGVFLGMAGPVLNARTIWPALPVALVALAGRLASRRVKQNVFVLPAVVLSLGFALPWTVKTLIGFPASSFPVAALEAIIGAVAAGVFSWGRNGWLAGSDADRRDAADLEDIASLSLLCAGITMGLAGLEWRGVGAGAVVAGLATIVIAYAGGGALGAVSGALMGLACAMSGQGGAPVVGAYAVGGFVAGVFRHHGKIASAGGFFAGASLLVFQVASGAAVPAFMAQLAASGIGFMCVPHRYLYKARALVPSVTRTSASGDAHARRVQEVLSRKLQDFSKVFDDLSSMLKQTPYDPDLAERADVACVLHRVAQLACSRCRSYLFCWQDVFHRTFRDVLDLVALAELKGRVDPSEVKGQLRRRCIDIPGLVAAVNSTTGTFRQNLTSARRLAEGRQMLSGQLQGVATILRGLGEDVWQRVEFETWSEERIAKELARFGFGISEVSVVARNRGRLDVTIKKNACCGEEECKKAIAPLVSRLMGRHMEASKIRCGARGGLPTCEVLLSQARVFGLATAASVLARGGSAVSGDTHSVLELADGRMVFVLSDGMGAGEAAAVESSTAVSMLERLLEAGFDDEFAVKTVNLILLLRSSGETFATLDVVTVDLGTGDAQFIKVGSPPSFIKGARGVTVIESATLPAGVFDAIDVEKTHAKLSDGDLLVMVSDGVLNAAERSQERGEWVTAALSRLSSDEPEEVARFILDKARQYYKGRTPDDMTVVVGRVYRRLSDKKLAYGPGMPDLAPARARGPVAQRGLAAMPMTAVGDR
ncbi:MAG TPA: stage II sporulation protein E [Firmicutes bacterium]|nr:stage II sporulation protein E [Bacillota bacterium]